MKNTLSFLLADKDLTSSQTENVMQLLCSEQFTNEQKAFVIGTLMKRGITPTFLANAALYLLKQATPLFVQQGSAIDVCGTGGDTGPDTPKSFNISTASAFILASGGVPVVKHGNRAISSQSGSTDVLEALGINLSPTSETAKQDLNRYNLCFVAAPIFHPVMKNIGPVRKALGVPTFFNLLGPLLNPAKVKRQLIGVYDPTFAKAIAEAAKIMGKTDVITVHSDDGMDEISLCAPTQVHYLQNGSVRSFKIKPEDFGLRRVDPTEISGGSAANNAAIIQDIFDGKPGPKTDIVCFNAAAAFVVAGKAKDMSEGLALSQKIINKGKALHLLTLMRG